MELLSFGLYLFSLVFLLFPFLLSCLSCDSFCWLPFRLRFFLLVPFVFPILFFFLLHLHFVKFLLSACKYSFHPAVSFSRLVLRSGTKPKRRQKRRQNSRQLRMNLARSRQTFFPILLLLRQLPLPLQGLVVLLLQAFILPAPAKHQQRLHHRDCCCCY